MLIIANYLDLCYSQINQSKGHMMENHGYRHRYITLAKNWQGFVIVGSELALEMSAVFNFFL